jgi:hypothetical protein
MPAKPQPQKPQSPDRLAALEQRMADLEAVNSHALHLLAFQRAEAARYSKEIADERAEARAHEPARRKTFNRFCREILDFASGHCILPEEVVKLKGDWLAAEADAGREVAELDAPSDDETLAWLHEIDGVVDVMVKGCPPMGATLPALAGVQARPEWRHLLRVDIAERIVAPPTPEDVEAMERRAAIGNDFNEHLKRRAGIRPPAREAVGVAGK